MVEGRVTLAEQALAPLGGADEDQPDKMLLLAEFLDAGLHPKLDAATSHTHATAIRASARRYRELIEAVRAPAARRTRHADARHADPGDARRADAHHGRRLRPPAPLTAKRDSRSRSAT